MSNVSKIVFLTLINILVVLLGIIWLSYLGVIEISPVVGVFNNYIVRPTMAVFKVPVDKNVTIKDKDDVFLLENERLKKKELALDIRFSNLNIEKEKIESEKQVLIEKLSEVDNIKKEYADKGLSFNQMLEQYADRHANYRKIATDLNSILPEEAVKIISSHEDQDIIEIFRATDEIAKEKKAMSLVPTWSALMEPNRIATIQRKMTQKPEL